MKDEHIIAQSLATTNANLMESNRILGKISTDQATMKADMKNLKKGVGEIKTCQAETREYIIKQKTTLRNIKAAILSFPIIGAILIKWQSIKDLL